MRKASGSYLALLLAFLLAVGFLAIPACAAQETDQNGAVFEYDGAGTLGIYGGDSLCVSYRWLWDFCSSLTGSDTLFRYSTGGAYTEVKNNPFATSLYTLTTGTYTVQTMVYGTSSNGSAEGSWQDAGSFQVRTFDYLTVSCNMDVSGLTVNGTAAGGSMKVYRGEIYLSVPAMEGWSVTVELEGKSLAVYDSGNGGTVVLNPLSGDATVCVTYTYVPSVTESTEPTQPENQETTAATAATTAPTAETAASTADTAPPAASTAPPSESVQETGPAQTQPPATTVPQATEPSGTEATGETAAEQTSPAVPTAETTRPVAPTQTSAATEPSHTEQTQPEPTAGTEETEPAASASGTLPATDSETTDTPAASLPEASAPVMAENQSDPFFLPALGVAALFLLLLLAAIWLYLRKKSEKKD